MDSQTQQLIQNYQDILEKTNHQLSLWSNPYGVAIGILSIFIALIAIGVAFAIWKNSKEQKEAALQFFSEQEKAIQARNKAVEDADNKLQSLINEYKKQLHNTSKEGKQEIEKAIKELNKEKASISAYLGPTGPTSVASIPAGTVSGAGYSGYYSGPSIYGSSFKSMICSNCGKTFKYSNDLSSSLLTIGAEKKPVYCTFCRAKNYPV